MGVFKALNGSIHSIVRQRPVDIVGGGRHFWEKNSFALGFEKKNSFAPASDNKNSFAPASVKKNCFAPGSHQHNLECLLPIYFDTQFFHFSIKLGLLCQCKMQYIITLQSLPPCFFICQFFIQFCLIKLKSYILPTGRIKVVPGA